MRFSFRLLLIVVAALVLLALPSFATLYTDWLWFRETGYETIFTRSLTAQSLTGLLAAGVSFLFLVLNARIALSFLEQPYLVLGATQAGRPLVLDRRQIRRLTTIGAFWAT